MSDVTAPDAALSPVGQLLLQALPFARPTTIVDVGANPINEAPYSDLLRAGGCHVVGFEPQPSAFAELEKIKGPNETYFPHAVGDGSAHELQIYRHSGLTSLFKPHLPGLRALGTPGWARIVEKLPLQTVALDSIPDLPPMDCLKIDIQGGEQLVIENARRVMRDAVCVIIELRYMQMYEGEPMMGRIDEILRHQGFMLHKFMFNKSKMMPNSQSGRLVMRRVLDQLVDGDAVYLRHPGKIAELPDGQVMHMALLAATVFHSHSCALYCLDELVARGLAPADLPERYVDALPEKLWRKGDDSVAEAAE